MITHLSRYQGNESSRRYGVELIWHVLAMSPEYMDRLPISLKVKSSLCPRVMIMPKSSWKIHEVVSAIVLTYQLHIWATSLLGLTQ